MKILLRILGAALLLLAICAGIFYFRPVWVGEQRVAFALWRLGVSSRYIQVDGHRIHYLEAVPPAGVREMPLLLVHGLGGSAEDWTAMTPSLAKAGFHVYAPDLLGFGRSDQPDVDYSISLQEDMMVKFLAAVGVAKADVGGWSMGGWVATKLTLDHPELVERLVLYDAAGIYFAATFENSLFTPTNRAGLEKLFAALQPYPLDLPDFVVKDALRTLQQKAWVIDRSVAAMTNGRDLLDFRLARMRRPVLIVWGTKDALIPLDVGESMHHLIPDSSLVQIDGCGHMAAAQCPESVLSATIAFLHADPPWTNIEKTLPGN